ncbi:MAG: NAD(P)H-hydrate dehydratase [Ignavibacteriales bacterium]|nr:NAD(P)H-hydrate dehydratase [Ignavibacteriales bacterium]
MIPLFSSSQIKEADHFAITKLNIPSIVLMENAALSTYNAIKENIRDLNPNERIGLICGKGNNGGDGFTLARHLLNNDYFVNVIFLADEDELKGNAQTNFLILKNLSKINKNLKLIKYKSIKDISKFKDCTIVIDALLGTGTKGRLKEPYDKIINGLNELDSIKIAIDLPSGLDVDTGKGDIIFDADLTITMAEFKTGLFHSDGYKFSGKVVKGYIGLGPEYFDISETNKYLIEPEDAIFGLPIKEKNIHKYTSGKVLTIAGSGKLPGAGILATRASMKAGAGASILVFPRSIRTIAHSHLKEAIVDIYEDDGLEILREKNISEFSERIEWADVIAIGPGLGRDEESQRACLKILQKYPKKIMIIDADALYAMRNEKYKTINLKNKILTPHNKEFADLLGINIHELQSDILYWGKQFATETECILVLKGAPTIIFNSAGEIFINTSGNPGMAKFGTGDVLTGILAGFCAQTENIEDSVIAAVYLHSLSADVLLNKKSEFGLNANDILENLPSAIQFLRYSIAKTY